MKYEKPSMRYSKDIKNQANELISQYYRLNLKDMPNLFAHVERIRRMIKLAKEHHKIQEHDCNGTKTKSMETRENNIETEIIQIAASIGLRVHFDGDPRGYTVKLHASNGELYNTWGGCESGYGIG